ncbi:hypothetical protein Csa_007814 [Cucumis sativus]|uniref:Uncharacterized protein n=1 Tax=Cucumis sativus TaxID=3659 RepID=A0A0A0KRP6_CUCSA|nr:hypothetical protein Csa_007814 [Cucumis sativus]
MNQLKPIVGRRLTKCFPPVVLLSILSYNRLLPIPSPVFPLCRHLHPRLHAATAASLSPLLISLTLSVATSRRHSNSVFPICSGGPLLHHSQSILLIVHPISQ